MTGFVSIDLDTKLSEQLARAQRGAADLTPAMDEVSELMLEDTQRRFLAEVEPGGVPWKRSRRAIEEGGKTLQLKGFLLRSLDRRSGATFAEVGVKPGAPQSAYAAVHQFGSTKAVTVKAHTRTIRYAFGRRLAKAVVAEVGSFTRKMNTPARPYLGFDPDVIEDIALVFQKHLRRILGETA